MIVHHLCYELYMAPIVYMSQLIGLFKVYKSFRDIYLIAGWVLLGPFYMIYGVGFDMIQLVKVLRIYKIDNDKVQREADEQAN